MSVTLSKVGKVRYLRLPPIERAFNPVTDIEASWNRGSTFRLEHHDLSIERHFERFHA